MSIYEQQQQQQHMPLPMLTLCIGGVSFSLSPTTSIATCSSTTTTNHAPLSVRFFHPGDGGQETSSVHHQQQQQNDDVSVYCMQLESFTGTLRIEVMKPPMYQASLAVPPFANAAAATTRTASTSATTASEKVQGGEQQQQQHQHGISSLVVSSAEDSRTGAESSPLAPVAKRVTPKTGAGGPSFLKDTTCSAAATAASSSASSPGQEKKQDEISKVEDLTTTDSPSMAFSADNTSTTATAAAKVTIATGTNATVGSATASLPSVSGHEKHPDHSSLKRISFQPDETLDDSSLFKRQKCSSQFQVDDDDDVAEDDSNDYHQNLQAGGSLSQSSTLLAQEDLTQGTQYSSQMVELHENAEDEEDERHDAYSPNLLETPPPLPPNEETNNNSHDDATGGCDTNQATLSSNDSQCLRTILENNHSRDSSTSTTNSAFSSGTSTSRTNASTRTTNEAPFTRNSSSILDDMQDDSEDEEDEEDGRAEMEQEQEGNNDIDYVAETKMSQEEEQMDATSADSPQRSIVSRSPLPQQATTSLPLALPLTSKETSSPCPRWGHTMTDLGDGRLLVYGGQVLDTKTSEFAKTLNDLHVYNIKENKWYMERVSRGADSSGDTDVVGGLPRQWHTATFLPDRHLLIYLGGEAANPKTGKTKTMDPVMVLDTEIMVFYPPVVSGDIPNGRSGHTACLLLQSQDNGTTRKTEELVVFGGIRRNKWLNSVSVLNTQTWVWRTPRLQGMAPRPRSYHSATAISNRIVIFGGNNAEQSFNTIHVLEQNVDNDGNTAWRWTHPNVRGHPPKPRTGHSATLLADQTTICFYGGWDLFSDEDGHDEEFMFQDSFLLDTEKWEWKPGPVIENDSSRGDKDEGHTTTSDAKRVGHTSVLLTVSETENSTSQKVLIFGGRGPGDRFTCDFKSLRLDTATAAKSVQGE